MTAAEDVRSVASGLVAALTARAATVATAESLTGGLLGAALTDVAGASAVYRGGVVAYATDLKVSLLGVDADLLRRDGAVSPRVAAAMARGVRARLGADYGLATTGVAGPAPQDGQAVGTGYVAAAGPTGILVGDLVAGGNRAAVRQAAVLAALRALAQLVAESPEREAPTARPVRSAGPVAGGPREAPQS